VWVADITSFKVGSIYRYLAVAKRRPPVGLIFYTDLGIGYYTKSFMESFFHSMKS